MPLARSLLIPLDTAAEILLHTQRTHVASPYMKLSGRMTLLRGLFEPYHRSMMVLIDG